MLLVSAPVRAEDAPAAKPEISTEKLALAKKYLELDPVEDEIRRGVAATAEGIEADQRVLFRSMADKHIDFARARAAAEVAAASVFTEKELEALIAFFKTPEGQSIRSKMPEYQNQVRPTIAEILKAFIEKIQSTDILQTQ